MRRGGTSLCEFVSVYVGVGGGGRVSCTFHCSMSSSSTFEPGNMGRPQAISKKIHPHPLRERERKIEREKDEEVTTSPFAIDHDTLHISHPLTATVNLVNKPPRIVNLTQLNTHTD